MIDSFSEKIAKTIRNNINGIDDEKEEIIGYGIKIIIFEVLLMAFVIVLSAMAGIFSYILLSAVVYGSLRIFAGGAHAKSRIGCTASYIITLFGIVMLSVYIDKLHILVSIPFMLFSIITIILYSPGDTAEKPILSKKQIKRQRIISIILALCWYIIASVLYNADSVIYNIIVLSSFWVAIYLSPIGYKLTSCKYGRNIC